MKFIAYKTVHSTAKGLTAVVRRVTDWFFALESKAYNLQRKARATAIEAGEDALRNRAAAARNVADKAEDLAIACRSMADGYERELDADMAELRRKLG